MICRFFSYSNTQNFFHQWKSLINVASEGYVLYWGNILSDNLATHIINFRSKHRVSGNIISPFDMSCYVMDSLSFIMDFISMGWKWTLEDPIPIHIYHDILWDSKYHPHFYKTLHRVMLPIHQIIFDKETLIISLEDEIDLLPVGNYFGEELFTYILVFGSLSNPHFLPLYVPYKLLAWEIRYKTVGNGISRVLKEFNKKVCHVFPLHCGMYTLENFKHVAIEINSIIEFNFPTIPNRYYNPHQTVKMVTAQSSIR